MFIAHGEFYPAWEKLLKSLVSRGVAISPRNLATKEILGVSLRVYNGRHNILYHPARNLNYKFMVAEWLWICSGSNDVEEIARYNSEIRKFSDDGKILYGAYGPRLEPQLFWMLTKLNQDGESRQVIATIWRPNEANSKDVPCTISMQLLLREGKMNLIVSMRSSDAWLGLPYDFFVFSMILNSFCGMYECSVGFVQFNLGSSHLYNINLESAQRVIDEGTHGTTIASPELPGVPTGPLLSAFRNPGIPHFVSGIPWRLYADVLLSPKSDAIKLLSA